MNVEEGGQSLYKCDEEGEVNQEATVDQEGCATACEKMEACMQWQWRPGQCRLHDVSGVRNRGPCMLCPVQRC